jgi:RNA polymerase primary sigma factor
MSNFRSNGFEVGANEYIQMISGVIPPKCEVLQRGQKFQSNHQRFRKSALGNRLIMQNCLHLLSQLDQKKVRWDFVFELSMNQKDTLSDIKSSLPSIYRRAKTLQKRGFKTVPNDLRDRVDSTKFRTGHLIRWTVEGLHRETSDDQNIDKAYASYVESKRDLANSCLMLVVKIAHQFRGTGRSLMELVQDGNIGVMVAAEKYDPELGWTFSAYASHWIRRHIFLGLAQRSFIKVPHGKTVDANRYLASIGEMSQNLGREINAQEQHELLEKNKLDESMMSSCCRPTISLAQFECPEEYVSPSCNSSVRQIDCPVKSLKQKELASAVARIVHRLDARERKILEMRFGLNGEDENSLTSIASQTGLTHQRVHQILWKLKSELKDQLMSFS